MVHINLNKRDSVMTNADKLAKIGGGGNNSLGAACRSSPARMPRSISWWCHLGQPVLDGCAQGQPADGCDDGDGQGSRGSIRLQSWSASTFSLLQRHRRRRAEDMLNIGGFSDAVCEVIAAFAASSKEPDGWMKSHRGDRAPDGSNALASLITREEP